MRFVDYKCDDCGIVDEYVISFGDCNGVKCSSCGSLNTVRVFSPVSFKASCAAGDNFSCNSSSCSNSSSKSCSGGSCSTCSGCH